MPTSYLPAVVPVRMAACAPPLGPPAPKGLCHAFLAVSKLAITLKSRKRWSPFCQAGFGFFSGFRRITRLEFILVLRVPITVVLKMADPAAIRLKTPDVAPHAGVGVQGSTGRGRADCTDPTREAHHSGIGTKPLPRLGPASPALGTPPCPCPAPVLATPPQRFSGLHKAFREGNLHRSVSACDICIEAGPPEWPGHYSALIGSRLALRLHLNGAGPSGR